jgi:hypothetical protein
MVVVDGRRPHRGPCQAWKRQVVCMKLANQCTGQDQRSRELQCEMHQAGFRRELSRQKSTELSLFGVVGHL